MIQYEETQILQTSAKICQISIAWLQEAFIPRTVQFQSS